MIEENVLVHVHCGVEFFPSQFNSMDHEREKLEKHQHCLLRLQAIGNAVQAETNWLHNLALEGGTHVRMEHSGFRPEDEPFFRGASYGWQKFIGELERVLSGLN